MILLIHQNLCTDIRLHEKHGARQILWKSIDVADLKWLEVDIEAQIVFVGDKSKTFNHNEADEKA